MFFACSFLLFGTRGLHLDRYKKKRETYDKPDRAADHEPLKTSDLQADQRKQRRDDKAKDTHQDCIGVIRLRFGFTFLRHVTL